MSDESKCPRCQRTYRFHEEIEARLCAVCVSEIWETRINPAEANQMLAEAVDTLACFHLYNKNLVGGNLDRLHEHGCQGLTVGAIRNAAETYAKLRAFIDGTPEAHDLKLCAECGHPTDGTMPCPHPGR